MKNNKLLLNFVWKKQLILKSLRYFVSQQESNFLYDEDKVIDMTPKKKRLGYLTICPTPIGNLKDMSLRQYEAIVNCDIIACEDTRTLGKLLKVLKQKEYHKQLQDVFSVKVNELKSLTAQDINDQQQQQQQSDEQQSDEEDENFILDGTLEQQKLKKMTIQEAKEYAIRKSKKILRDSDTLSFIYNRGKNQSNQDAVYGLDNEFIQYMKEIIKITRDKKGRGALISYHKYNEEERLLKLLKAMQYGLSVVLVSDAGTPTISDPGYKLIDVARKQGFDVDCIPGQSAVVTALLHSGFPIDNYAFEGYITKNYSLKESRIKQLKLLGYTSVLFESNSRLTKTLQIIEKIYGEQQIIYIGQELTKFYENHLIGEVKSLYDQFFDKTSSSSIKGEVTIVIAPYTKLFNKGIPENSNSQLNTQEDNQENFDEFNIELDHATNIVNDCLDITDKELASLLQKVLTAKKNDVYQSIRRVKHEPNSKIVKKYFRK